MTRSLISRAELTLDACPSESRELRGKHANTFKTITILYEFVGYFKDIGWELQAHHCNYINNLMRNQEKHLKFYKQLHIGLAGLFKF